MLSEGCLLMSAPNCLAEGLGFVTDPEKTCIAKNLERPHPGVHVGLSGIGHPAFKLGSKHGAS